MGARGMEDRRLYRVAAETAPHERPELQMATHALFQRSAGKSDGLDGKDLPRQAAENKITARTHCLAQAPLLAVSSPRQWRPAGRIQPSSGRSLCSGGCGEQSCDLNPTRLSAP